jgi:hypothetical protein
MMANRNAYTISVRKSEGKRSLERSRRRWEDNIEMDFREITMGLNELDCSGSECGLS